MLARDFGTISANLSNRERNMNLIDRIGIDLQAKMSLEDAIDWAAANGVSYIDAEMDVSPNQLDRFDAAACDNIRSRCEKHGIHLGLHTLSSVNTAEISPFVSAGVDNYLKAYADLAVRVGAEWTVIHAGFHFGDRARRMQASLERLKRVVAHAEAVGAKFLLENLNREPDMAEVHYLAHSLEECQFYFDRIDSPNLGWSFTVNHATLEPEGIDGFLDALPLERCGEVRLADNHGEFELHMFPGEGLIDFGKLFARIEGAGYKNHYMCNFGTKEEMLDGRKLMADLADS
ncbi:MAG: sugar phosphate isomerase/epimerase [Gammaproteobacteria bacterium]|nr:sugar phosphate isomerase/epimerase [Gammaproteobacteria bacterium]